MFPVHVHTKPVYSIGVQRTVYGMGVEKTSLQYSGEPAYSIQSPVANLVAHV